MLDIIISKTKPYYASIDFDGIGFNLSDEFRNKKEALKCRTKWRKASEKMRPCDKTEIALKAFVLLFYNNSELNKCDKETTK